VQIVQSFKWHPQGKYCPELEDSAEFKINGVRHFQELFGVLHWEVELGFIDIAMEVSMLSSHIA
jgi:hypothetical protein